MSTSHPHVPVQTGGSVWRDNPLVASGAVGLAIIWAAVIAVSLLAPDLVSGSEQNHVPIAALLTWIWGLIASRSFVTTLMGQRERPKDMPKVWILTAIVAFVWLGGGILGAFGPEDVTGADPTRVPVAALIAPIAAMLLTTTACQLFRAYEKQEDEDQ